MSRKSGETIVTVDAVERDPDESKTFSNLIARMEEGRLDNDLTAVLTEVVARLQAIQRDQGGKPSGQITLAIKFKLDDGMIETRTEFAVKMPKEPRIRALFWPTDQGTLTLRNPRQRQLPFGVRDINSVTIKDVG